VSQPTPLRVDGKIRNLSNLAMIRKEGEEVQATAVGFIAAYFIG
jgi:hypothetical protein